MKIKSYLIMVAVFFLSTCGGSSPDPNGNPPDTTKWVSVSTGGSHTCAIKDDGTLWCWGFNRFGQLGIGSNTQTCDGNACALPIQVTGNTTTSSKNLSENVKWTSISAGNNHSCGIQSDNSLWCWGYNNMGQLGNGESGDNAKEILPIKVDDNSWISIVAGDDQTCGVKSDGTLWCLSINNFQPNTDSDWVAISSISAYEFVVAKSDSSLWKISYWNVSPVNSDKDWKIEKDSFTGGIAIKKDGTLWDLSPKQIDPENSWNTVQGVRTFCATKVSGTLWCWGDNEFGQIGNNSTSNVVIDSPFQVGSEATWTYAVGGKHSCGIKTDGTLWCWGYNGWGQLGIGNSSINCFDETQDNKCADEHSPKQVNTANN